MKVVSKVIIKVKRVWQLVGGRISKKLNKTVPKLVVPGLVTLLLTFWLLLINVSAQSSAQFQQNSNYLRNSSAFRQEIARFEITVTREGKKPLPLSQVPRVQQGDVIKVRLLEEAVNGIKPDQSQYDWTMLVTFINPNRKISDGWRVRDEKQEMGVESKSLNSNKYSNSFADNGSKKISNSDKENSVSPEINFRKTGWYREYSFTVPYDSLPIFFLYPKPNYRSKILSLINKNSKEIKQLGEKTIELAGAYEQISLFLNELQQVISGNTFNNGTAFNQTGINPALYKSSYRNNYSGNQLYNYNLFIAQSVERMARAFNLQLPSSCWQGSQNFVNSSNVLYNNFQPTISPELIVRLQCVAKNIRLEDFDFSLSKLLQQGGMLLAVQLQQKYPQLSYWINIAALAIDLIVKITRKSPLKIMPAISSSPDNPITPTSGNAANSASPSAKISLFGESQPDDRQFVTAYPIVLQKWQADADAEVISLRPPVLMEPCLHVGVNILKATDLTDAQINDNFTKNYTLTMTSTNGFKKQFPLKKNIGLNGWELNITTQDLQNFPKIPMSLESTISGTRGFNEIKSPPFYLPISIGGSWQITSDSQQNFIVGGKRKVIIRNTLGNCQCLQAVIYKPSFGGQFVYEANPDGKGSNQNSLQYSPDNKEVSFEVEASNFQAGNGEIELRTYGGEVQKLPLKLYALPPVVTNLKISQGDREGIISGDRLEQVQAVKINDRIARVISLQSLQSAPGNGNQPNSATPQLPVNLVNYVPNLQTSNPNEWVIVFEENNTRLTENTANLELILEDNRTFRVKQTFPVAPSRPSIVANENREIEGMAIDNGKLIMGNTAPKSKSSNQTRGINNSKAITPGTKSPQLSTINYPLSTFLIDTSEITLSVQNAVSDYDFKIENLSVEMRLEKDSKNVNPNKSSGSPQNSSGGEISLPKPEFEILDGKNLRITFKITEQIRKLLGGRRLQFRIRDRERGDSDWYSIKQTFVRVPKIDSITCTNEMNGMCEMKGSTIDYISQVSIDGGQSWFPKDPATLQVQPTKDGNKLAMIPLLTDKKLLLIKLRDFPKGEGIGVDDFSFLYSVQPTAKPTTPVQQNQQTPPNNQNGVSGQLPNPNGQNPTKNPPIQNKPLPKKQIKKKPN